MTVRIIWQGKIRAILCPKCNTAHQVSAQKDNLSLRCSRCNTDFNYLKKGIKLRNLEKNTEFYASVRQGVKE